MEMDLSEGLFLESMDAYLLAGRSDIIMPNNINK
jgi:hypothetical protein